MGMTQHLYLGNYVVVEKKNFDFYDEVLGTLSEEESDLHDELEEKYFSPDGQENIFILNYTEEKEKEGVDYDTYDMKGEYEITRKQFSENWNLLIEQLNKRNIMWVAKWGIVVYFI